MDLNIKNIKFVNIGDLLLKHKKSRMETPPMLIEIIKSFV